MPAPNTAGEIGREALLALSALVEMTTGPDPELVAQIRCAAFAPHGAFVKQSPINGAWCVYEAPRADGRERSWEYRGLTQEQRLGDFLGSVDAALSLVPEGWKPQISQERDDLWRVNIGNASRSKGVYAHGRTAARAITAAALKARAVGEGE